ncbi:MAG: hypothetical protein VXZ84_09235 [Planctomycetota bacterium]|nr:hypothetical protein [Planctomycetota bacterium]
MRSFSRRAGMMFDRVRPVTKKRPVPMFDLIASTCFGVCWFGSCAAMRNRVVGTTLVGPWIWSMVAAGAVIATSLLIHAVSAQSASLLVYLAVTATLCPVVALLGAKKPQNRAWQWIVGALWLILSLPALTAVTFRHTQLQLGSIWSGLIIILILLPIANYLGTRYLFSALLTAVAQVTLLAECGAITLKPNSIWIIRDAWFSSTTSAVLLLLVANIAALFLTPRRLKMLRSVDRTNDLWKEFSQRYGLLWSRRVADRAEKLVDQAGVSLRLGRAGFYTIENQQKIFSEQPPKQATLTLRNLLLRFVSPQWMAGMTPDENP